MDKLVTIVYIGSLPSGSVRPLGDAVGFEFVRGKPVQCSSGLAAELVRNDPESWKLEDTEKT